MGTGRLGGVGVAASDGRGATAASTKVFQAPQAGQRPSQRALGSPQSVHRCSVRLLAMSEEGTNGV
jgi:hypothetical protein